MVTGDVAGPLLRAEDARPGLARHRHADLLPAAAGRPGRVVRARQGRPVARPSRCSCSAPYDQYVTPNTRFWQASGIDVSLSASGLSVQTQSLLSILVGGIAFETPADRSGPAAGRGRDTSSPCSATAPRPSSRRRAIRRPTVLVFKESVRGLTPRRAGGVPRHSDRRGHRHPRADRREDLRVLRAGDHPRRRAAARGQDPRRAARRAIIGAIRRQLHRHAWSRTECARSCASGSLLTGALFVAFDFFPDAPPATIDWSQDPVAAADHARASSRRSRRTSSASSRSSTSCRSRRSATICRRRSRSSTRRSRARTARSATPTARSTTPTS